MCMMFSGDVVWQRNEATEPAARCGMQTSLRRSENYVPMDATYYYFYHVWFVALLGMEAPNNDALPRQSL